MLLASGSSHTHGEAAAVVAMMGGRCLFPPYKVKEKRNRQEGRHAEVSISTLVRRNESARSLSAEKLLFRTSFPYQPVSKRQKQKWLNCIQPECRPESEVGGLYVQASSKREAKEAMQKLLGSESTSVQSERVLTVDLCRVYKRDSSVM